MTRVNTEQLVDSIRNCFGNKITTADIKGYCASSGISYPTVTRKLEKYKVKRGSWDLTIQEKLEKTYVAPSVDPIHQNLVPQKDDTFVQFGNFKDVKKIISSVEQSCAQLGRELIRVNITIETDEDDLIGGFRLIDGNTVWHNGPVIEALERGAVLLLDEIDLASNKILCLQSILEGKGVFLKKIGKNVTPAPGFNVIATANTKGKGSDDGRFIGTNVLNEAFLERFPVTFEQSYPTPAIEQKILEGVALDLGVEDRDFCKRLVDWGDIIRKTFYDGGIEEVISTRRLVHIIRAYSIWGDKQKSIEVCLNRFDDETKTAFIDLYDKVDADVDFSQQSVESVQEGTVGNIS
jgi:hypothetical protein